MSGEILPSDHQQPAPVPSRVGQATAVEQSRAVAEVQAAVLVAQATPRSISTARAGMQQSCQMHQMAEKAFFRYRRGGSNITGATVHLARELARCWGNVQYGINELRRDDEHGESEMQAWAWDVQTNARSSQTFIVPHKRDKQGGPEQLTDLRDIYENNANMGARRLREAIFSILPPWFKEEAQDLCTRTLQQGDGKPLEERIDGAIRLFATQGITKARLEQKLGRVSDKWSAFDISQLLMTWKSIERGEIALEDEFPQPRVTSEEITAGQAEAKQPPAPSQDEPPPPSEEPAEQGEQVDTRPPTKTMMNKLFAVLADIDVGDDRRHGWAAEQLHLEKVDSFQSLTRDQVNRLIDIAETTKEFGDGGDES